MAESPSPFFRTDVVRDPATDKLAMVLRTYAEDQENPPAPPPPGSQPHPLDRMLAPGELGVSFMFNPPGAEPDSHLQIRQTSTLDLVDRLMQPGDVCKRSLEDVQSGAIKSVHMDTKLEHVISGQKLEAWVPSEDLVGALKVEVGDRVINSDWIGIVEELFEEGTLETPDGGLWRVADMGGQIDPGRSADDLFPPGTGPLPGLVYPGTGSYTKRVATEEKVIDVQATVLCINWIAINQQVPIDLQDQRPKPKRYWAGPELLQLTHVTSNTDHLPQVGAKVCFKTPELEAKWGLKPTIHVHGTVKQSAMLVRETRTSVTVVWQDGTETTELTVNLIPRMHLDEYECWPGMTVVWKSEEGEKVAVVQKVNAAERTVEILPVVDNVPSETLSLISIFEIDPIGPPPPADSFGVTRGDLVLIGSRSNGCTPPAVPRIGLYEERVPEDELRATMASLGLTVAPVSPITPHYELGRNLSAITWYGEVKDLRLDGKVEITLPDGCVVVEELQKLSILNEGADSEWSMAAMDGEGEADADMGDGEWEDYVSGSDMGEGDVFEIEVDQWEGAEDDVDAVAGDDEGKRWDMEDDVADEEAVDASMTTTAASGKTITTPHLVASAPIPMGDLQELAARTGPPASVEDDPRWERFAMLEEAPEDHHFYKQAIGKPNSAFVTRLQKEFKVLKSSLPETILVRTYEDRMDLLRCIIIGPSGTPYVDAPHLIDFYLDPQKFPFEPPKAFFHSWTRGMGRCNPNLYEDGKVCLSILGTWQGEKSESWNPHKSSLLQTFVSIQGLVLVREPYFCEPAFDKLRGTKEALVNSRQYNEKAFILSRAFVLHVLTHSIGGLDDEMKYYYFTKGKLASVLDGANELVSASENAPSGSEGPAKAAADEEARWNQGDGVGKLSLGAILPLKKTIAGLEKLRAAVAAEASDPGAEQQP